MLTFADLRGESRPDSPTLFDAPPVVRTFDTPEFRGITFYEVEAKSVLNRVPGSSSVPFQWTVNVYRGCSHACSYCALGDTPILMADGRTKPIADLRVGDAIYGTVREGNYRRYVVTHVLAHWSTVKPAFRTTLEDGTELITSGDHRFLSDRGWKYVTGAEQGADRRPHLTVNNKLIGTGEFASPPDGGADYQRGYLCGMIRGDGHPGSCTYPQPDGSSKTVHRFRPALVDFEALGRAYRYLSALGVETTPFVVQRATTARATTTAVRASTKLAVTTVKEITAWPREASDEWAKGFLAGIFDAEGGCGPNSALRISNTDQAIIDRIASCLRRFGFPYVLERPERQRGKPVTYVRLTGGLRERLRYFHTVDPAITRKRTIGGMALKSDAPLRVVRVEPLGVELPMYDITTGTGDFVANGVVSHNCFARPTHTYLNFDAGEDFERKLVVKVNAPDVLRRELGKRSWKGEHVAMGTNTDPYQRAEGRYRLTRAVLEVMRDFRNPCSILTKSPLLTRDLDVMVDLHQQSGFSAALSIGTLDEDVWRRSEPGTPHPLARIAAVKTLREAGIPGGVLMGPVIPGLSDHPDQLRAVVEAAADAGASHISGITLHLRRGVKEGFLEWLEREYPHLMPEYREMYRGAYAPKAVQERIRGEIAAAKRDLPGAGSSWRESVGDLERAAPARREPEQLTIL